MKTLLAAFLLMAFAAGAADPIPPGSLEGCAVRYAERLPPSEKSIAALDGYTSFCDKMLQMQQQLDSDAAGTATIVNQRFNTNVLLWMVVVITISGVGLAAVQLYWSYRLALTGQGQMPGGSETKLSKDSLVVKSSVVGVVILGFSLIFFIVFVLKVYPLTTLQVGGGPGDAIPAGILPGDGKPK